MKREDNKVYQVIMALPRRDFRGGLKFWCPWCQVWHLHGRGGGHRVSHCAPSSPLYEHGYFLKPLSRKELRQLRDAIQLELDNPMYNRGKLINKKL